MRQGLVIEERTAEMPLTPAMRAVVARYRRVSLVAAVLLLGLLSLGIVGTLVLLLRPNLVPDQGEATLAAALFTVVLLATLSPMLVGILRTVGRYALIRTYRATSGPIYVDAMSLTRKMSQFDPALSGTNFDRLSIGDERLLLPQSAAATVAALRSGTVIHTSGGEMLFEVRAPDGRVVYRCAEYAGESEVEGEGIQGAVARQ
jgi:hypothetical protein